MNIVKTYNKIMKPTIILNRIQKEIEECSKQFLGRPLNSVAILEAEHAIKNRLIKFLPIEIVEEVILNLTIG